MAAATQDQRHEGGRGHHLYLRGRLQGAETRETEREHRRTVTATVLCSGGNFKRRTETRCRAARTAQPEARF